MLLRILIIASLLVVSGDLLAKSPGVKTVPISVTLSGYVFPFNVDPDDIADRCSPPEDQCAWGIASFIGWGDISHLGESEFYAEHCSYGKLAEDVCVPDGTYGDGEITTIADNGDVLKGTYDNGVSTPPPDPIFEDVVTFIDGGTGRFTFASGGGVEIGTVDFSQMPPSFTIYMEGEIAYKRK